MMLTFIVTVAVILYVSQAQVDIVAATPMTGKEKLKLVMLLLAILVILFVRFGR